MTARMRWHGEEVKKKVIAAASKALQDSAEHVLTESNKTNPYREGVLERSGATSFDQQGLEAAVYYDTPYAIKVHEQPGLKYSDPKARWKWLEMTVKEQANRVVQFIADRLREAHR